MPRIKPREEFFDGDDKEKWSEEAQRQITENLPGKEPSYDSFGFRQFVLENNLQGIGVDFGCGTGQARPVFEGMGYIGIDQNPDMIEGLQKRWKGRNQGPIQYYQTPLTSILQNFPDLESTGDAGLFITVLQHNHYETAGEILDQAFGVLKPGAVLFMMEATYTEEYYPENVRIKYDLPPVDPERLECVDGPAIYTPKGWFNLLAKHGFELVKYTGKNYYVFRSTKT